MTNYFVQFSTGHNVVIKAEKYVHVDGRIEFWRGTQLAAVMPLANMLYVLDQDWAKVSE